MLAMLLAMIGTITYLLLTVIVLAGLAGVAITASENPVSSKYSQARLRERQQGYRRDWHGLLS